MPACGSPYSGSAKRQATVCPLVAGFVCQPVRTSWMRSERSSLRWEGGRREGGREGEVARCDAVVFATVAARMLRVNRAQVVLFAVYFLQVNWSRNEGTCSRVRAWGWHENVRRALMCQVLCGCRWPLECEQDCGASACLRSLLWPPLND